MTLVIRNAYSKREPSKTNVKKWPVTQTVQDQADSTDINRILARFAKTGVIDHVTKHQPVYADVHNIDYHEALNQVKEVESIFMELPAVERKKFGGDPAKFVEYLGQANAVKDMSDGSIDEIEQERQAPAIATPVAENAPSEGEKE
jgi:phage internal scaffolding protein